LLPLLELKAEAFFPFACDSPPLIALGADSALIATSSEFSAICADYEAVLTRLPFSARVTHAYATFLRRHDQWGPATVMLARAVQIIVLERAAVGGQFAALARAMDPNYYPRERALAALPASSPERSSHQSTGLPLGRTTSMQPASGSSIAHLPSVTVESVQLSHRLHLFQSVETVRFSDHDALVINDHIAALQRTNQTEAVRPALHLCKYNMDSVLHFVFDAMCSYRWKVC
jgi:hypothetical protein